MSSKLFKTKNNKKKKSDNVENLTSIDSRTFDPRSFKEGIQEGMYNLIINKSGFPLNRTAWDEMWKHISHIHPCGKAIEGTIRDKASTLSEVPFIPPPCNLPLKMSVPERLNCVQEYMLDLQYNHTGTQFFEIKKTRSILKLMNVAKSMIRESLPIKCLEAVILATYLTNDLLAVDRFPISFRTNFGGHFHRHVVLGIAYNNYYASLGMSRREDLMYKPLIYKKFSELILEFKASYEHYMHKINRLKIGLPISHNPCSDDYITWKYLVLDLTTISSKNLVNELERFSRDIRRIRQGLLYTSYLCVKGRNYLPTKDEKRSHPESEDIRKVNPEEVNQANIKP